MELIDLRLRHLVAIIPFFASLLTFRAWGFDRELALSRPLQDEMEMTELWSEQPADKARAKNILALLKQILIPYKDYRIAIKQGYEPLGPLTTAGEIHFYNRANALQEQTAFDPRNPTALLYKPQKNGGYELRGVMYTAPIQISREQLNRRIPLSVARWHFHKNRCLPDAGAHPVFDQEKISRLSLLSTQDECLRAGGRFKKDAGLWMLHVYPFEKDIDRIWRRGM